MLDVTAAVLDIRGLAETRRLLADYEGQELQNKLRQAARAGLVEFRQELRAEAASRADLPRSFRKTKTRTTTRGGESGHGIEAYVRPSSPLFNIFEPGAGEHVIAPRRAGALGGPKGSPTWDRVGRKRKAAFFSLNPVKHPGMRARPLLAAVFASRLERAEDAIAVALFERPTAEVVGE